MARANRAQLGSGASVTGPRSVLVTGGSRGIGLAIARSFVELGDRVTVTYRTSRPPDDLSSVHCDVSDAASVDSAFDDVVRTQGDVEVLVSNAGVTEDGAFLRMREEQFQRVVDTNLLGAYRVARRGARGMIAQRRGRLIFISSVAGLVGAPGQANYASSKAGLIGLARTLAREFATAGITANVIAPGLVETDMTTALGPERLEDARRAIPTGRLIEPDEVASAATWLASSGARSMTGSVITLDGGLSLAGG